LALFGYIIPLGSDGLHLSLPNVIDIREGIWAFKKSKLYNEINITMT
jgi:hypothetical protein